MENYINNSNNKVWPIFVQIYLSEFISVLKVSASRVSVVRAVLTLSVNE